MLKNPTMKTITFAQMPASEPSEPSEAWFCSRFLPVSEGVFPCHCRPRLALRGSQARALCKAALRQSCIVKSAIQITLNRIIQFITSSFISLIKSISLNTHHHHQCLDSPESKCTLLSESSHHHLYNNFVLSSFTCLS